MLMQMFCNNIRVVVVIFQQSQQTNTSSFNIFIDMTLAAVNHQYIISSHNNSQSEMKCADIITINIKKVKGNDHHQTEALEKRK